MDSKALNDIQTPAYVADIAAIKANMEKAAYIKAQTGCQILLATKAFAMPAIFPYMKETLDGTTASGPYEARLGAEHFGKQVHTYCPAYTQETINETLRFSDHIYFNSISQLNYFASYVKDKQPAARVGLRANAGLSLVTNSALYDPSSPGSRYGVQREELTDEVINQIDILHIHNLCENMAEDSARLINHIMDKFTHILPEIKGINLGGGHYFTHPDYKTDSLIKALKTLGQRFPNLGVTLEPGGALVYEAGYLVATVLDIFENANHHAIIDASASTHMPDVLEVPYTPEIIGAGKPEEKAYTYTLGGNTCMTGDVIGTYSFDSPLEVGQKLIFTDMMQYSFVKNTTFNGVPLPDLGVLHEDQTYELVRRFDYSDFIKRLS
ncbi:MAG: carboxynorspermidine decarboxylase [Alphaproteobacteria bacterium]